MTPLTSLNPEEAREGIRKLLLQFERFGVDTGTPDLISATEDELAVVRDSRRELVSLLTHPRAQSLDALGAHEAQSLLFELVRLSVRGRLQAQLSEADVPYPIYNFFAGFDENAGGPWDGTSHPSVATGGRTWRLLGHDVRFPLGVPASGLTANSTWIRYFARRGFNVITFKTVRSREYRPHYWPHWVFIEDGEPWMSLDEVKQVNGDLAVWPKDLSRFSTANSFGVPSASPDEWRREVEKSLGVLGSGQMLILSVMGDSYGRGPDALVEDFVNVATKGESTGVPAIELNLSCPNTPELDDQDEPQPSSPDEPHMAAPVCTDPEMTGRIVRAVRSALHSETRLVAKLGYLPRAALEPVVAAVGPHVDAISGINTVPAQIRSPETGRTPFIGIEGDPTFQRDTAGVSGEEIRPLGLDFVASVSRLRGQLGYRYDVIGMGGVMNPDDVDAYFAAGASGVQSATGVCLNPDLAVDAYTTSRYGRSRTTHRGLRARVAAAAASGGYSLLKARGGGR